MKLINEDAANLADVTYSVEELYDKYAPALMGIIHRIVREEKKSESLLTQCFIEINATLKEFDPAKEAIFTWMFRMARDRALEACLDAKKMQGKEIRNNSTFVSNELDVKIRDITGDTFTTDLNQTKNDEELMAMRREFCAGLSSEIQRYRKR